jgi:hypothetical protein
MSPILSKERCRPRCSGCLEVGHTKASLACPIRIATIEAEHQQIRVHAAAATTLPLDWPVNNSILCAQRYQLITTCEERMLQYSSILAQNPISILQSIRQDLQVFCHKCSRECYKPLNDWCNAGLCDTCYLCYRTERELLWGKVREQLGPLCCVFCGQECFNGGSHLDHLNMFEKGDSVCSLVARGAPWEIISFEVGLCQVLCKSCHAFVTHCENILGFRSCKIEITKLARTDPEVAALRTIKLAEQYRFAMCRSVYPFLTRHGISSSPTCE